MHGPHWITIAGHAFSVGSVHVNHSTCRPLRWIVVAIDGDRLLVARPWLAWVLLLRGCR